MLQYPREKGINDISARAKADYGLAADGRQLHQQAKGENYRQTLTVGEAWCSLTQPDLPCFPAASFYPQTNTSTRDESRVCVHQGVVGGSRR